VLIVKRGQQDSGVVLVVLFAMGEIVDRNIEESFLNLVLIAVDQAAKDRIAVETGQTAPNDAPLAVD
jgi:hypothetical protein